MVPVPSVFTSLSVSASAGDTHRPRQGVAECGGVMMQQKKKEGREEERDVVVFYSRCWLTDCSFNIRLLSETVAEAWHIIKEE